jgi:imidazolonepropionase-like amidohydrolase
MKSVFAKTLYTGKAVKSDCYLNFKGRNVVGVSAQPKGRLMGRFETVTPALIDPHSHIGLIRSGEPSSEAEGNEQLNAILALSDALDSFQSDDSALKDAVEMGVLYTCILPGSGNIIGGMSAIIRNYADNSSKALIRRAGIKAALGFNPMNQRDWKGERPSTRMGAFTLLRTKLDTVGGKMQKYAASKGAARQKIVFNAEEKVLRELLFGNTVMRTHVHKIDDIAALLRLVDQFNLKVSVEHALDVHQADIFIELKKRGIPVIYGPMDCFAYKVELKHAGWRNARHLLESGVDFGLMTDHPVVPARNLLLQTRWFIRAGMSKQAAMELVTRKNAAIIGIDDILGTLVRGHWASFVCWNGDPFDISTYPQAVYGEGVRLYPE